MYHVSLTSARESIAANGLDASKHRSPWADLRSQGKLLADQPVGNYVFSNLRDAMGQQMLSIWQEAPTDIWRVEPFATQWILDPELIDYAEKSWSVSYFDDEDICECHASMCIHESEGPRWYSAQPISASSLTLVDPSDKQWINIARNEQWLACMKMYAENIPWSAFHVEGKFSTEALREARAKKAMAARERALEATNQRGDQVPRRPALPANVV